MINLYDVKEKDNDGKPIENPLAESEKLVDESLKKLIEDAKNQNCKKIYSSIYKVMEIWKNAGEGSDSNKSVIIAKSHARGLASIIDENYLDDKQKEVVLAVREYKI